MHHPQLVSSLVLVDPIVVPLDTLIEKHIHALILGAAARQTHWPDRQVAVVVVELTRSY